MAWGGRHGDRPPRYVKPVVQAWRENRTMGISKGKGFQGVVRRFKFGGGRASHGGGWRRKPGSIGNREWPGRIFKNKKLPGQMGSKDVTTQNLRVVKVLADDNALLLEGAVPGPAGGLVLVRKAIKKA